MNIKLNSKFFWKYVNQKTKTIVTIPELYRSREKKDDQKKKNIKTSQIFCQITLKVYL